MRLYELTGEFDKIRDQLEEVGEDPGKLADLCECLDALQIDIEQKLDSCGKMLRQFETDEEGLNQEIERLQGKQDTIRSKSAWLKLYIARCLGEGRAIKTKLFSFTWRKSKAVNVISEEDVPLEYMRTTTTVAPDKARIKCDLEVGSIVPGCELLERQSLQIK